MPHHARLLATSALLLTIAGCSGEAKHEAVKAAKVEPVAHESELMKS